MDEGSMFEEPDFSRAQSAESDDGYEDDLDEIEEEATDEEDDDLADEVDDGQDDEEESDEDEDVADSEDEDGADEEDIEAVNRVHGAAARAVLEHVTRALVDDPDSVVVEVSEGRSGLRFSVHVAQGDMGRLIGRKGRTAQAIRTLVRAAAASDGTEASVDIVD
ncbi:MAG: KH domain-containing protein [Acidimicrobiales bacterium]|jgi:predicted RNA-binding protein YlqC (UPF0109 family)